jgi:hypothetical protein
VDLSGSRIAALNAEGLRTDGNMSLRNATLRSSDKYGAVRLSEAHIGGHLNLRRAEITNDTGPALRADWLQTDSSCYLEKATLIGAGESGTVRLYGAHVDGQLDLDRVEITNDTGPALIAGSLRAAGNMSLQAAAVTGTGEEGAVRLSGAHIGRYFDLDGARFTNDNGSALDADDLRTGHSMFLRDVTVTGMGKLGAVRLRGAHIGGQLVLSRAEISNDTGPALYADGLRTNDNMFLQKTTMTGKNKHGAVQLDGVHIGGRLVFDHAEISNDTGPALTADGLRTNDNMSAENATMTGTGEQGAVRLCGAHIGGQLNLSRAEITNDTGPALYADGLHTDDTMSLENANTTGKGKKGTIRLPLARIGGQLHLNGIRMSNESGPLIALSEADVSRALTMPASVVCPDARVDIGRSGCPDGERRIIVGNLVYPVLSRMSWQQWLHLLMHHTDAYWPQSYQQLAAVERAAGHDNNARLILIVQQEDLRRRNPKALGGRLAQARHRLWGWLGRYGYRAHRLVAALAVVLALAGGLGYMAGQVATRPGHHAAERVPSATSPPGTACSPAELIGLGIDRGLPLSATGVRARCDLDTGTRWGQAFTYTIWALQALVWGLATLAIAAYTGLVRKPT